MSTDEIKMDNAAYRHYRVYNEDTKTSRLYKENLLSHDDVLEITEHHDDGTSTSYEPYTGWMPFRELGDEK